VIGAAIEAGSVSSAEHEHRYQILLETVGYQFDEYEEARGRNSDATSPTVTSSQLRHTPVAPVPAVASFIPVSRWHGNVRWAFLPASSVGK